MAALRRRPNCPAGELGLPGKIMINLTSRAYADEREDFDPADEAEPAPGAGLTTPRVSVVDDEEDLHAFLKDVGESGHFQLAGACYSAAEAMKRVPAERPDAVIMDIRLPDMSGIDCTTKLKTVLPRLPIIMLTGYPDGRAFFRSLMAGAKGFLV